MNSYPARLAAAATLRSAWTDVHDNVLALLPREAVDSRRAGEPQRLKVGQIFKRTKRANVNDDL